eukprot:180195_1
MESTRSILQDSFDPTESLSMVELLQAEIDNQRQAQDLSQRCGTNLNECTYHSGHLNQPVFACLTCYQTDSKNNNNNNSSASFSGICLGCSMNCHLDHNVIELWNKRHFRCDCGNSKFKHSKQSQCLLSCQKDPINELNQYNHNFKGKYCYCHREYAASQHTMHQCFLCQDWFHQTCIILHHLKQNQHLKREYDDKHEHKQSDTDGDRDEGFFEYFKKLLIPNEQINAFDSFICKDCAIKCEYLFVPYRWKCAVDRVSHIGIKRNVSSQLDDELESPKHKRRKLNDESHTSGCKRMRLKANELSHVSALIGGGLWFETDCNWVERLCPCVSCKEQHNKYGLQWLFEDDETTNVNVHVNDLNPINPAQPLSRDFSTDAMIADSIKKLPRQQTLDALNVMQKGTDIIKDKLFQYLKANPNKKLIDQNDIQNIFKT